MGVRSPPEELPPAVLWLRSRRHTFSLPFGRVCPLTPQPPRGEPPWATGPFCAPRAVQGWALALLQLLGAQGRENQRQAMWAPAFISQLQRGANKPCPHARRCCSSERTAYSPSPSALPPQKEDSPGRGTPGGPGRLVEQAVLGRGHGAAKGGSVGRGQGARRLKLLTLSHCGSAWDLRATHSG